RFAALTALGASTGRLGRGVIRQAAIASVLAVGLGARLARLFGLFIPPEVPTLFRTDTLVTVSVFTLVAGVVGALLSLRRIARIDPATAIGGAP
ncbi:MAG: FtsX-like permease family protein, partial [Candidatus Nanopelagicales bacterium]